MPIPVGITTNHLRRGRNYFYEKLIWTGWPFGGSAGASGLSTGISTLFDVQNWNEAAEPTTRAEIEMLQMSQQPTAGDVTLTFTADPQNETNALSDGDLTAARAGERLMPASLKAVDHIAAKLDNSSGAVVDTFTGNVAVSSRRLTVLDKIFATRVAGLRSNNGRYDLTAQDVAALEAIGMTQAQAEALVGKGTMPLTTEQWLRILIDAHTVEVHDDFFSVSVTSDDNPFAPYVAKMDAGRLNRGIFLVLDRFANEGGNKVKFTVNRDADQDSYWTFDGAAFTQSDDAPWEPFVMAFDNLTIHATNDTGASGTQTVGVRTRVREVAMTDILAVLTGRVKTAGGVAGQTFAKAQVGLVSG